MKRINKLLRKEIEQYYSRHDDICLKILMNIDSTNSFCLKQGAIIKKQPLVCVAEQQTSGRGRFGKQWLSPSGDNIYFSYARRIKHNINDYSTLSLAIGLAVIEVLLEAGVDNIGLKWPNDILAKKDYKKVGGILIESLVDDLGFSFIVVGIGLNFKLYEDVKLELSGAATSLNDLTKHLISRNYVIGMLIEQCNSIFSSYEQQVVDIQQLCNKWSRYDLLQRRTLVLHRLGEKIFGIYKGIDQQGCILIENDRGTKAYHSGEVSVAWK